MVSETYINIFATYVCMNMGRHGCPDCNAVFDTKVQLTKHRQKKNPCNVGFPCNQCGKNLKTAETRRKHQKHCTGPEKTLEMVQAELDEVRSQLAAQTVEHAEASSSREPLQAPVEASSSSSNREASQPPVEASSPSSHDASQPPADNLPAVIDWPDFFEFGDYKIRKTGETP